MYNKPETNSLAFKDSFKCTETFNYLISGCIYQIDGFGTDNRIIDGKKEKVDVWYIKCLNDEDQEEFTIIKTTLNKLYKRKMIIYYEESV